MISSKITVEFENGHIVLHQTEGEGDPQALAALIRGEGMESLQEALAITVSTGNKVQVL